MLDLVPAIIGEAGVHAAIQAIVVGIIVRELRKVGAVLSQHVESDSKEFAQIDRRLFRIETMTRQNQENGLRR